MPQSPKQRRRGEKKETTHTCTHACYAQIENCWGGAGTINVRQQQAKQRMSPAQRGTIYHLVQAWGTALAARTPEKKPGASIRSRWQIFNDRFNLGTYTDLPAARYDEAIQFIKEQYHGLTGQEIDAIEQSGLEFDE